MSGRSETIKLFKDFVSQVEGGREVSSDMLAEVAGYLKDVIETDGDKSIKDRPGEIMKSLGLGGRTDKYCDVLIYLSSVLFYKKGETQTEKISRIIKIIDNDKYCGSIKKDKDSRMAARKHIQYVVDKFNNEMNSAWSND